MQLNGSASGNSLIADYGYDPLSRRTSLTRGNGVGGTTSYGYSFASRLTSLVQDLEGSATANDANWAFSYNVAGQVTSRSLVWAYERTVPALNQSYTADGLNRYSNVGGAAFNYDGRQNLISDGSRNFSYDYENRLTNASGSVSGSLTYDPLGRLHSYTTGATTIEFLYDGDRLIGEFAPGQLTTPLRRYAHGPGVDEPLIWYEGSGASDPRWLIADRQGSIIATTNASGGATIYGYGPYGEPHAWSGAGGAMLSRFRYTGQIALPELQLYHYKARIYDPGLGRFLQTDPIGYDDDLNLYAYVRNDPVNNWDPSGTDIVCDTSNPPNCRETNEVVVTTQRSQLTSGQFRSVSNQISNQLGKDALVNYVLPTVAGGAGGVALGLGIKAALSLRIGELAVGQAFGRLGTVVGKLPGAANALELTPYSAGRLAERGLNMQTLRGIVAQPLVVLEQANGRTLYISASGAVVVGRDGVTVVTAYGAAEFDGVMQAIVTAASK